MTKLYNSKKAADIYNKSRQIPESTMDQWMDFLIASVPKREINTILDLGCGTGRFSYALSKRYSRHDVAYIDCIGKSLFSLSIPDMFLSVP
ncbi:MAG: methyltransferase [Chitinispirillia bacterium]